jgi:hypothetical protein
MCCNVTVEAGDSNSEYTLSWKTTPETCDVKLSDRRFISFRVDKDVRHYIVNLSDSNIQIHNHLFIHGLLPNMKWYLDLEACNYFYVKYV